ncbi:hypothetical protein FANTH_14750 [Fusarium anthophilum]|uniref:Integral membrane protein n=1 Tax=Fusarium anthophilum TaxID=48485 RepID=A0A8H4YG13_9HYPO|nr:hypothetical protein FANTH_14750 [Fusarium anthophilum]
MLAPREHATDTNKAPIVRAMTALMMVIAIMAATVRLVTRLTTIGSLGLDDRLVAASTVVAIIQSVIVIFEGSAGLVYHKRGTIFMANASIVATNLDNPMFDGWASTLMVQVIQCMSILVTCVPFLKPFMDSLESGQMSAGDGLQPRTQASDPNSRTNESIHQREPTPQRLRAITSLASNTSYRMQSYEMVDADTWDDNRDKKSTVTVTARTKEPGDAWGRFSNTSQSVLVHQTWQVEIESPTSTLRLTS